jgi:hypothetical protein
MSRRRAEFSVLMLLGLVTVDCGASTLAEEYPAVSGRRVQGTQVVAHGSVPYQLGAYELVFAESSPGPPGMLAVLPSSSI